MIYIRIVLILVTNLSAFGCQQDKSVETLARTAQASAAPGAVGPQGPQGPQGLQGTPGVAGGFSGLKPYVHLPDANDLGSILSVDTDWINTTGKFISVSGSVQLETLPVTSQSTPNFVQGNLLLKWDAASPTIAFQHFFMGFRGDTQQYATGGIWNYGQTRVVGGQRFPVYFTLAPGGIFRLTKIGGNGNFLIGPEWFYQEMN